MEKERIECVNDYIQEHGEVKLHELELLFDNVSSMTLRRDLAQLEERGDIICIRGGARSIASLSKRLIKEESYNLRALDNPDGKAIIAKKSVSLLQSGRSIYIDAGTTCMSLAMEIPNMALSVLTNAPNVAIEMTNKNNISVTMVCGQISNDNISVSGTSSVEFVRNINIDIAFIATSGFSLESGFTTGNANECELKRAIIKKARQVVILMDSNKLDHSMMFTFATLKDVSFMICDEMPSDAICRAANKSKVKII